MSKLVVLKTYSSDAEAELAHTRLREAGVEADVASDGGHTLPQLDINRGVRLRVIETEVDKAREILGLDGDEAGENAQEE